MKTRRQQRGVLNHSPAGAAAGGIVKRSRVILTVTLLPGRFTLAKDHGGECKFHKPMFESFLLQQSSS